VGRRDYEEAAEVLTKAADAGSTNYLVYHNLGVAHFPPSAVPGIGFAAHDPVQMDKAAASYRRAIGLAPAHVGSYEGLAGLMHSMQTFEPADLDRLERGLVLAPGNATIETGLAAGEFRAGRPAAGRARLERLLAGKGDDRDRGLAYARKVLATETLKAEMEEIDVLAKRGRLDEALEVVRRALTRQLEPGHRQALEKARRTLMHFRTVSAAVERANRGEGNEARRLLNELLRQNPERAIKADAERLLREIDRHEAKLRGRGDASR
jgi:tetratricopeptide (TPR) repeat protein